MAGLGDALVAAWQAEGVRQRKAPPAATWRGQLRELTRTGRGREALAAAGVKPRSLIAWLSGEREPSARSRAQLSGAYRSWFGPGWPDIEQRTHAITGRMCVGADCRDRGTPPHSPFRANVGGTGDFTRVREAWNRRAAAGEIESLFVDDVVMATDGFSEHPDFPGSVYTVVLE